MTPLCTTPQKYQLASASLQLFIRHLKTWLRCLGELPEVRLTLRPVHVLHSGHVTVCLYQGSWWTRVILTMSDFLQDFLRLLWAFHSGWAPVLLALCHVGAHLGADRPLAAHGRYACCLFVFVWKADATELTELTVNVSDYVHDWSLVISDPISATEKQ